LVNYYPLSKKKTAYIASTKQGLSNITPKEAIRMSMKPPKCTKTPAKRKKTKAIKTKLFAKSQECHWCQTELTMETATIDHVIPLKRGGLDHQMNMVLACEDCNQERGHSMPELRLVKG
jgi:5-methylcytosine-specific restriction endonuclease McrA